jgi:Fic family protein
MNPDDFIRRQIVLNITPLARTANHEIIDELVDKALDLHATGQFNDAATLIINYRKKLDSRIVLSGELTSLIYSQRMNVHQATARNHLNKLVADGIMSVDKSRLWHVYSLKEGKEDGV